MAKEPVQKKETKTKATAGKKVASSSASKTSVKAPVKKAPATKTAQKESSLDKTIIAKTPVVKPVKKIEKSVKVKKEKKPKKPKGRVKVVPLVIVAVLLAGIIVCERFFLDAIVKNVMVSVMQSSYGAKCDIERVDLELWDGSLVVEGFALADASKPMQNLFEFSRSSIDFDVTQIFLGRFIADELALEGFALGTARETSGELVKIIPEGKPSDDTSEGKFALAISDKKTEMSSNGTNFIEDLAQTYNPENMMASYMEQLQVPGLVEASQKEVEDITDYWQGVAPELEQSGQELFTSVEEVRALLDSDTVDIASITNGVNSIQNLISESQRLQSQVNEVTTRLNGDIQTVENLSSTIQAAVDADTNLVQTEIAKITSFSFADAQGLVGSTIEGFFVSALGDYYPMVQKGLKMLANAKASSQEAKQDEGKKATERSNGRTVHFNAAMPTFLIKNTIFSGSGAAGGIAVSGMAYDISNNPDLLQKPATAYLDLAVQEFSGKLDAVVDLRSDTENYPVEAVLQGSGLDTSSLTQSGSIGIPAIGGDADISADVKFELLGDFDLSANFDFNPALLSASEFEPSSVYGMYSSVLESINSFYVQSDVSFSFENGMGIGIDTNADKQIMDGLSIALNAEIDALKESLQADAQSYIASYTDGFMANVGDFGLASDSILNIQDGIGGLDGELESIKAELEQRIKDQAAGAIQGNLEDSNLGSRLQGLF